MIYLLQRPQIKDHKYNQKLYRVFLVGEIYLLFYLILEIKLDEITHTDIENTTTSMSQPVENITVPFQLDTALGRVYLPDTWYFILSNI